MNKLKSFIPFAVLAAGAFFVYFGIEHKFSFLIGIGLIFVAVGLVYVGFDNITKRKLDEYGEEGRLIASYSGISVVFIGIFWCVLGIFTFLPGIFFIIGIQQGLVAWLKLHPVLPFLLGGMMLSSYGMHEFLGSKQERSSVLPFLGSVPKRVFSAVLIITGLICCFLGLLNLVFPPIYDSLMIILSNQYEQFRCSFSPILCEE